MSAEHACTRRRHPNAESPYDEVLHKVDDSILSVKLPKNKHRIEGTDKHADGNRCTKECPKVEVMHNQRPPPKKPEEEMLILKTVQHITAANEMKHSLEVEFKSPRNYIPLPKPGPPPPIIVPKETVIVKADKEKRSRERKKK
ncbi:uncharacterized protein LOC105190584 [Harpegnathos saltator]|uniref:uncharacterized protein LOC105190584 n=1 Tax=Harpegnathos saltator TaxID=610380 RepID=UPI00058D3D3A|nr:uncharacterized protein LOC105190584 [Harpegnathos saltator]